MGVDTFWRRVHPHIVEGLDAAQLQKLVPYWFDDRFQQEVAAQITVGTEDCADLIGQLLRLGAGNDHDAETAWLAIDGAEGLDPEEDELAGALRPRQVARVAEFLSRADPREWMRQFREELAVMVEQMGYRRPFDDAWAQHVVDGAHELAALFRRAAEADEAVVVSIVA